MGLRRQVLAILREVIDFDAYVWLLTDPVTTVGAAPLADVPCLPELPALIKAKYATPVNRWTALRHPAGPVGRLAVAVDGDLARSLVWREVMSRYAVGDVASVVFADQFGCWGFLDLWRSAAREPFSAANAAFLASAAAPLTTALRGCQARTFVAAAAERRPSPAPVVLMLDDDLRITSRTAASQDWLDLLLPPQPDERAIPASVYNVAAQLLAAEAGIDDHPASTRVHLAGGFWLILRAARLAADEPGSGPGPGHGGHGAATIVVTIEEASAAGRWTCSPAPSASPAASRNCSASSPPVATRARWHGRWRCPSTRSRTISSRSSRRPAPATALPCCPAPSAPGPG